MFNNVVLPSRKVLGDILESWTVTGPEGDAPPEEETLRSILLGEGFAWWSDRRYTIQCHKHWIVEYRWSKLSHNKAESSLRVTLQMIHGEWRLQDLYHNYTYCG